MKTKTISTGQLQALKNMRNYGPQEAGVQIHYATAAALVRHGLAERTGSRIHDAGIGERRGDSNPQYGLSEHGEALLEMVERKLDNVTNYILEVGETIRFRVKE